MVHSALNLAGQSYSAADIEAAGRGWPTRRAVQAWQLREQWLTTVPLTADFLRPYAYSHVCEAVLVGACAALGIPPEDARRGIMVRLRDEDVADGWEEVARAGILALPELSVLDPKRPHFWIAKYAPRRGQMSALEGFTAARARRLAREAEKAAPCWP